MTITEHCFEKAILEAEVMVKREAKGRRIIKKDKLTILFLMKETKKERACRK